MSSPQMGSPSRMRANRSVVEAKCLTCGFGFNFGEEVVVCNVCGGFHHSACWDMAPICNHNVAGAAPAATTASEGTAPGAAAAPLPPGPAATQVAPPPVSPAAPRTPAADEQYCPQCREIVKREALKCRFCGYILSAQLAAQQILPAVAAEINSAANTALWCGIIGLFICGPVLGTIAIVQSNKAIREIDMAPQYSTYKGKATAGRVLGIIAVIGWIIVIAIRIGNMS
ncbi:MAG TPA: RING finger protein [Candidatus Angelobacter sp.]